MWTGTTVRVVNIRRAMLDGLTKQERAFILSKRKRYTQLLGRVGVVKSVVGNELSVEIDGIRYQLYRDEVKKASIVPAIMQNIAKARSNQQYQSNQTKIAA